MKAWLHRFLVMGSGSFPLEMLWHDQCFPWDTTDAVAIREVSDQVRSIYLAHIGERDWTPTAERWNSFSWGCFDHTKRALP